jgi:hypothetical protein
MDRCAGRDGAMELTWCRSKTHQVAFIYCEGIASRVSYEPFLVDIVYPAVVSETKF